MSLFVIGVFWLAQRHNHAIGETENKRTADQDNEICGKKGHDKDKRVIQVIGPDEQLDTVI